MRVHVWSPDLLGLQPQKGAVEKAAVDHKRSAKASHLQMLEDQVGSQETGCHQSASQVPIRRWDELLCGDACSLCADRGASTAELFQWHEWLLEC